MSVEMDDEQLRDELAGFGEAVGKINQKTRSIYIKKLNHLKARQAMAEKTVNAKQASAYKRARRSMQPPPGSSNYQLDLNDDSDAEMENLIDKTKIEQKTRRRTVHGAISSSSVTVDASPSRSTRRATSGSVAKPIQTEVVLPDKTPATLKVSKTPLRTANACFKEESIVDWSKKDTNVSRMMDFSDSEQVDEEFLSKDTESVGVNTSPWLDRSSAYFGDKSFNERNIGSMWDATFKSNKTLDHSYISNSFSSRNHQDQWPTVGVGMEVHGSSKWQCVSRLLVICALIFFLALASIYFTIRIGIPILGSPAYGELLCSSGSSVDQIICLDDAQKKIAMNILDILASRAGDFDCGKEGIQRSLLKTEVVSLLQVDYDIAKLDEILKMIIKLPVLKIRLLDNRENDVTYVEGVVRLESVQANMSLLCRIRRSFVHVLLALFALLASLLTIIGIALLIKQRIKARKDEKREVIQLAQDIISLLRHHASACKSDASLQSYLSVMHVRDALIPIAQRKKKNHLWKKAVDMVSTSESRICQKLLQVAGEEFDAWLWIDASVDPTKPFDSNGKPLTKTYLEANPTSPCLKVSNIIENKAAVDGALHDTILDRCGTYHGILHMDSYEDCIYIKCVSESAAGQVYKYLHGWSYKGKLVSVRYVTPLMYRTLFPNSTDAMVPLRPSTYRRRSTLLLGTGGTQPCL